MMSEIGVVPHPWKWAGVLCEDPGVEEGVEVEEEVGKGSCYVSAKRLTTKTGFTWVVTSVKTGFMEIALGSRRKFPRTCLSTFVMTAEMTNSIASVENRTTNLSKSILVF